MKNKYMPSKRLPDLDFLKEYFSYNPGSGNITWNKQYSSINAGSIAGNAKKTTSHIVIGIGRRNTQTRNTQTRNMRDSAGNFALPAQAVRESWPTPTARDNKSGRGNSEREYSELTPMIERNSPGKLNPRWVETLMGLPIGWVMPSCKSPVTIELTNSDCSETEWCQPPPTKHFSP